MKKVNLTNFDKFIKNKLPKYLLRDYLEFKIISEADLQSLAWNYITIFIRENHEKESDFKVLNKPYLKEVKIHPDIVIFRKNKPWVVMELKESKKLKPKSAKNERDRLIKVKEHFGKSVKRGYLLFVTRYGEEKILRGPKGRGARFFFEVPISLEAHFPDSIEIKTWESGFRNWAKYSK
jgi:hypothetical protein